MPESRENPEYLTYVGPWSWCNWESRPHLASLQPAADPFLKLSTCSPVTMPASFLRQLVYILQDTHLLLALYLENINVHRKSKQSISMSFFFFRTRVGKLSVKGPLVNILGFVGHMVSVPSTQLCHCSMPKQPHTISKLISIAVF